MNPNSKAASLYKDEPYKWENLYQCTLREILNGDHQSIKALKILLGSLKSSSEEEIIRLYEQNKIFDSTVISDLKNDETLEIVSARKFFKVLRILPVIFANPYNLELKGKKNHLYEKTGYLSFYIRKKILRI